MNSSRKIYIYFFLIWKAELQRAMEGDRDRLAASSLSKWLQWPRLEQTKAGAKSFWYYIPLGCSTTAGSRSEAEQRDWCLYGTWAALCATPQLQPQSHFFLTLSWKAVFCSTADTGTSFDTHQAKNVLGSGSQPESYKLSRLRCPWIRPLFLLLISSCLWLKQEQN